VEGAPGAFAARVVLAFLAFFGAALALEGEDALVHLDLDVLGIHARDVGEDDEAVGLLLDVHPRCPLAGHHVGRIGAGVAEQALEHLLELVLQVAAGKLVVTDNSHAGLLARSAAATARR